MAAVFSFLRVAACSTRLECRLEVRDRAGM
jgi:hypothetical protein